MKKFEIQFAQQRSVWILLLSIGLTESVIEYDPSALTLNLDGSFFLSPSSALMLNPIRNTAPDTDLGPWCKNFTNIDKQFHTSTETARPIYNYPISNNTCGSNPGCLMSGCVMYRESSYKSGIQQWLGCSVVFPWWYGAGQAGNRTSLPCPYFDNITSTFWFRGVEYYNFMRDYGHPYGAEDCHHNILCSPSTHYFDPTQYATLKWCQETPAGYYSPQCNNTLLPCTIPDGQSMGLRYFSSHGRGVASGCGFRRTAPAIITKSILSYMDSPIFAFSVTVTIPSPSSWTTSTRPTRTILFGSFPHFYVGLSPQLNGDVIVLFYHTKWTVKDSASVIESSPILLVPNIPTKIAVQGDGQFVSFWVNDVMLPSSYPQQLSTASIGRLNMTGLPSNYTDGSLVHVGYFAAGLTGDFINATTLSNPYGTTETFASITVSDFGVVDSIVFTTTTTAMATTAITATTTTITPSTTTTTATTTMTFTTTPITTTTTATTSTTTTITTTPSTTTMTTITTTPPTTTTTTSTTITTTPSTTTTTGTTSTTFTTTPSTTTVTTTPSTTITTSMTTSATRTTRTSTAKTTASSTPTISTTDSTSTDVTTSRSNFTATQTEMPTASPWNIPGFNGQSQTDRANSQNGGDTSKGLNVDDASGGFSFSPLVLALVAAVGVVLVVCMCYCMSKYKFIGCFKITKRGRRSVRRITSISPTEIVVNR